MKLTELTTIPKYKSTPISTLKAKQLAELQTALGKLGYPAGDIDDEYGHNTRIMHGRNSWTTQTS